MEFDLNVCMSSAHGQSLGREMSAHSRRALRLQLKPEQGRRDQDSPAYKPLMGLGRDETTCDLACGIPDIWRGMHDGFIPTLLAACSPSAGLWRCRI
jgi:hypothetical protein